MRGQLKNLNNIFESVAVSGYDKHLENVRDKGEVF